MGYGIALQVSLVLLYFGRVGLGYQHPSNDYFENKNNNDKSRRRLEDSTQISNSNSIRIEMVQKRLIKGSIYNISPFD